MCCCLTEALVNLQAARTTVADQDKVIADFLKAAYANKFVKAETTEQAGSASTKIEADDVIQGDIGDANDAAAAVIVSNASITESTGAAFNALNAAQQEARIAIARVDLQKDIDEAQKAVDTAAGKLKASVPGLVATAQSRADGLVTALDAQDDQDIATGNVLSAAGGVAKGTSPAFTIVAGVVTATDTNTADITAVSSSNQVSFTDAVALNAAGTDYIITLAAAGTITISKSYLDAVLAAAQADVNTQLAVTAAENALASAMVDVLKAQDSTFVTTGVDYTSLVADLAVVVTPNPTAADTVALDYSKAKDGSIASDGSSAAKVAVDGGLIKNYDAELDTLATKTKDLADFNKAVADWEGTDALAQELAALNAERVELVKDVTAAEKAITNATDADPAGLGVSLVEANAVGSIAFTAFKDDLYLFNAADVDGTIVTAITVAEFSGNDKIYFGKDFNGGLEVVEKITEDVGNLAKLEIFAVQNGTNVDLYVEERSFAGNGSGTDDLVKITLTGVNAEDLSFADGFLTIA